MTGKVHRHSRSLSELPHYRDVPTIRRSSSRSSSWTALPPAHPGVQKIRASSSRSLSHPEPPPSDPDGRQIRSTLSQSSIQEVSFSPEDLASNVKRLLNDAGTCIGYRGPPEFINVFRVLSCNYLEQFANHQQGYEQFLAKKTTESHDWSALSKSKETFNSALRLIIDFYVKYSNFATALKYGLLFHGDCYDHLPLSSEARVLVNLASRVKGLIHDARDCIGLQDPQNVSKMTSCEDLEQFATEQQGFEKKIDQQNLEAKQGRSAQPTSQKRMSLPRNALNSRSYLEVFPDGQDSVQYLMTPEIIENERALSESKAKFNSALAFLIDFYLTNSDFTTALQYALLFQKNCNQHPLLKKSALPIFDLTSEIKDLLQEAGKCIGVQVSQNVFRMTSREYLHQFATKHNEFENHMHTTHPHILKDERASQSKAKFHSALGLIVGFYLEHFDFATALEYGLLAHLEGNGPIVFQLVHPLLTSQALDQAKETLEKMNSRDAERTNLLFQLGEGYFQLGQVDQVEEVLSMMNWGPNKHSLTTKLIDYYLTKGQLEAAADIFKKHMLPNQIPDYALKIANKFFEAGRLEDATVFVDDNFILIEQRDAFFVKIAEEGIAIENLTIATIAAGKIIDDKKKAKSLFITIFEKHIEAGQLKEAADLVKNNQLHLADQSDFFFLTISKKYIEAEQLKEATDIIVNHIRIEGEFLLVSIVETYIKKGELPTAFAMTIKYLRAHEKKGDLLLEEISENYRVLGQLGDARTVARKILNPEKRQACLIKLQ